VRTPLTALVTVTVVCVVEPLTDADSGMGFGEIVKVPEFTPVTVAVTVTEAVELSVPVMATVPTYVPGESDARFELGAIVRGVVPTVPDVAYPLLTSSQPFELVAVAE
jgi:hypothetical protein